MARLSKQQWAEARAKWEADSREGFDWLANELGNVVSRQAISKTANKEGWTKGGQKVSQKVAQPKKQRKEGCATKSKVAQPKSKTTTEIENAEWEEVNEIVERLHGNSKYNQLFDEQAYKLCLLGAIDEELSDFFHVDERTINRWKVDFPSFCQSIEKGKLAADAEAAYSLFKRACGYRYKEVKAKEVLTTKVDEEGNEIDGDFKVVEVITTEKEVQADVKAISIWLRNRRSQNWRDKQEIDINHKVGPDMIKRLETEMMERMERARQRQLAVLNERGIEDEE